MDIFGSSGVRGVAGKGLSPDFVLRVARAAATEWDTDRVAVARDTRTTGQLFANIAAGGIASTGAAVDRLGVAPTPAVTRYCEHESIPAVLITASHNPPEYNGIKLVGTDGIELSIPTLERIETHILEENFAVAPWNEITDTRRVESVNDDYIDELVASVDREAIAAADLTVAIDPGHGAGALTSPEFYRRLGCTVLTVNGQPDGHFPGRLPEPVEDHLGDLCRLVASTDADVGIAHDGDADRAIFVDEDGTFISGEESFAALAAESLSAGDSTVAAVNVSQRLVDVCNDVGATLELTPIGATNIITRITELWDAGKSVPIAGEGNGGIFFPNYRLVRDGAYIGAKFLELLVDRPASEVVAPYQDYYNVRRNLEYEGDREKKAMVSAAAAYVRTIDADINSTDGFRMDHGDAWVLVRPSGTEPKIRIYAEASDPKRADELATDVYNVISDAY
ncbi:phosphoglucosamine mutase [Halalkalirubrum salinum]|uniref:phosphoglucosamine mutase n=1 Tax=Halalkalirubrum salinum TaxID=2563889 RepID=UPI0010FB1FBE|nr:phosphoglucosamine mutase [Halalkalirubrum salinum]